MKAPEHIIGNANYYQSCDWAPALNAFVALEGGGQTPEALMPPSIVNAVRTEWQLKTRSGNTPMTLKGPRFSVKNRKVMADAIREVYSG